MADRTDSDRRELTGTEHKRFIVQPTQMTDVLGADGTWQVRDTQTGQVRRGFGSAAAASNVATNLERLGRQGVPPCATP